MLLAMTLLTASPRLGYLSDLCLGGGVSGECSPKCVGLSAEFTCIERLVDGERAGDEAHDGIGLGRQNGLRQVVVADARGRAVRVDTENDEQALHLEADLHGRRRRSPAEDGGQGKSQPSWPELVITPPGSQ